MTCKTYTKLSTILLLSGVGTVTVSPAAFAQQGIAIAGQFKATQANDLITGQNKNGPYPLAWNHFLNDNNYGIVVVVDGVTIPEEAYTLDIAKGTISFGKPLKSTSIARVGYQYDPAVAKRNADFMQAPITIPLMHAAGTNFQLTALPDSLSGTGSTKLVYGLDRHTNLLGGGLTSKALVADNGSSLNFGYKYGGDRNGLDAAFQRTERAFASHVGKSLNLGTPLSSLSVGGHLRPANFVGLGMTMNDQHDLVAGGDTSQHGMTVNLGGVKTQPVLNFARLVNVTDPAKSDPTDVTTDKVDLAAKVGGATALTAKGQRVVTDAPGDGGDKTAQDATVGFVAASKDKKRQASVSLTDSTVQTATADNKTQDIQIKLQPITAVTISAEQKGTKNAPAGTATTPVTTDTQTTVAAEVVPLQATKLTGTLRTDINGDNHTSVTDLNAQVGTGKAIELGGGITDRSAESAAATATVTGPLDTKRANVALRPFKALTLTGGYTWNPEKDGRVTEAVRQDVGLNARLGALDLGSVYSMTTLNGLNPMDSSDPQFGQVSLSVGLRFSRYTSIKGNYQDYLMFGANSAADGTSISLPQRGSRVYGLNLTHSLGPGFNVSMNGTVTRNYATATASPDYKAQATIGAKF